MCVLSVNQCPLFGRGILHRLTGIPPGTYDPQIQGKQCVKFYRCLENKSLSAYLSLKLCPACQMILTLGAQLDSTAKGPSTVAADMLRTAMLQSADHPILVFCVRILPVISMQP